MKRLLIASILATMLLATGCNGESTDASVLQTSAPYTRETIDTFGIVKATDVTDIRLDFPAFIEDIHIKEGQKVKKGDALFTINYDEYLNQINSKNIELITLKQQLSDTGLELGKLNKELARLKKQLNDKSYPELKKLTNDLDIAEKAYADSQMELNSNQLLLNSGSISQSDFDVFKKTVDANKKSVFDIKASIEKTIDSLNKEIDQLELNIGQKSGLADNGILNEKIKACEDTLKLMNSKITKDYIQEKNIVSRIDNAIAYDSGYVKGEALSPTDKCISLFNLDSIIIEANVPEEFIKDVNLGSEVTVIPQADKSKEYKGTVTYIANKAVQRNGETTVLVQASIDNNDGFLMPDFNVNLEIDMP